MAKRAKGESVSRQQLVARLRDRQQALDAIRSAPAPSTEAGRKAALDRAGKIVTEVKEIRRALPDAHGVPIASADRNPYPASPAESPGLPGYFKRMINFLASEAGVEAADDTYWRGKDPAPPARRPTRRKTEPRKLSVAAAVAHYLCGEGFETYVTGSPDRNAALTPQDVGVLLVALALIAEGDGDEVDWRAGTRGTRRIGVDGGERTVLDHLALNRFLTHEKGRIGYGPLTLEIARKAGVKLPEPVGASS